MAQDAAPNVAATAVSGHAQPPPVSQLTFEKDIRSILKAYCFDCHGAEDEHQANLDLRLRRLMVQGGDSGPAVTPGQRDASLIYERISQGEMPPREKKLTADQVALIGQWIDQGAATARDEPEGSENDPITFEERQWWAFQPIRRPAVGQLNDAGRVRTDIDAFLLAAMQPQGLSFSPDADKLTLLKRASFDLTGLPPSADEVAMFMADTAPDAYERLLDRLLASPHYGERWARHWLDVAGYADSDGYTEADTQRLYAYKYRDYVIRSLNADKPFDQFIREQLAGDEMVAGPYNQMNPSDLDKVVATGFLRMGPDGTGANPADMELARNQVLAETIKIVSTSLLGLTVGCCQCHDHRYDPIPQADYYRLRAVFEPAYDWTNWRSPAQRLVSLYTDADRQKVAEVEAQAAVVVAERSAKEQEFIAAAFEAELAKIAEAEREAVRVAIRTPGDQRSPEQTKLVAQYPNLDISPGNLYQYNPEAPKELEKFDARIKEIRAQKPVEDFVSPLNETPGNLPVTYLFHRGDHRQPKQPVAPGALSVCAPPGQPFQIPADDPSLPTSGRRLAFAHWLTSGEQPLTARVLVNRFWMHHFGRGIVGTPGDFGTLGDLPSHPELLDWLADEFTTSGWSLKRLHKLIMMSTAFRQSSERHPDKEAIDPDNRWYWRIDVRRLEAEAVRDRILAASGVLNIDMFGPPTSVVQDGVGQIVVGADTPDSILPTSTLPGHRTEDRRSIYMEARRSQPLAVLTVFDAPVMETNCDRRVSSTVAPQSLMLMNSDFMLSRAAYFAIRLTNEAGPDAAQQVARAWQLALVRSPTEAESQQALAFLAAQVEQLKQQPLGAAAEGQAPADHEFQALASLCQVLLSSNEFLYID